MAHVFFIKNSVESIITNTTKKRPHTACGLCVPKVGPEIRRSSSSCRASVHQKCYISCAVELGCKQTTCIRCNAEYSPRTWFSRPNLAAGAVRVCMPLGRYTGCEASRGLQDPAHTGVFVLRLVAQGVSRFGSAFCGSRLLHVVSPAHRCSGGPGTVRRAARCS